MEKKLIEAVKRHEVLYKKCSLVYRNKLKRAAAWNSIANELDVPEIVCKSRWKSLRDRFVKKHTENYNTSGSGAELEETQWQYYQQMEFLRDHIKPRKTVSSLTSLQLLDEQARKKRKLSTDQMPIIESDEMPSSDYTHTDNTEIPVYSFLGKFEVQDEDDAEDTEFQTLNKDKDVSNRKSDQMFNNNYEHILNDMEEKNKNVIENQSIILSSAINSKEILKKDPLDTKKLKNFKDKKQNIESFKNTDNGIFCQASATNEYNNHREEEQLMNFFRSCIDDILMLDKRKQRLFKKRILDTIEELQDS